MSLQVQRIFAPISNNLKSLGVAATVAGVALFSTSCSESRNVEVDNSTLHTITIGDGTLKMQDGVSFEVKSKIFLMQDGQLWVYDKKKESWTKCDGNKIHGLYGYQRDVLSGIVADTKQEIGNDGAVLSKEDIKYWQNNQDDFSVYNRVRSSNAHGTLDRRGYINKDIKLDKGISIYASQEDYDVSHATRHLNILYDMDKQTVVEESNSVINQEIEKANELKRKWENRNSWKFW